MPSSVPPRGQHAAERADVERHRRAAHDAVPGVDEPEDLVAVVRLALADDGADDGVQAGAVAASRHHTDAARPVRYVSVAWDASRRVPWKKVLTPFALYAVVAVGLFSIVEGGFKLGTRRRACSPAASSTPALAALMVKFGWNPPMFQSRRSGPVAAQAAAERRPRRSRPPRARRPRCGTPPGRGTSRRATRRTNATNPKAKTTRR